MGAFGSPGYLTTEAKIRCSSGPSGRSGSAFSVILELSHGCCINWGPFNGCPDNKMPLILGSMLGPLFSVQCKMQPHRKTSRMCRWSSALTRAQPAPLEGGKKAGAIRVMLATPLQEPVMLTWLGDLRRPCVLGVPGCQAAAQTPHPQAPSLNVVSSNPWGCSLHGRP